MAGQQSRECHNQTSQDGAAPTASSFPRSVHQTSPLSPACHIFPRIPTDALIISVFSLLADLYCWELVWGFWARDENCSGGGGGGQFPQTSTKWSLWYFCHWVSNVEFWELWNIFLIIPSHVFKAWERLLDRGSGEVDWFHSAPITWDRRSD